MCVWGSESVGDCACGVLVGHDIKHGTTVVVSMTSRDQLDDPKVLTMNSQPGAGRKHPADLSRDELLSNCTVERSRSSGPGGQHRNKVETAVTLIHQTSGERGVGRERRSQKQNLDMAVFRLRLNLAVAVRCPVVSDGTKGLHGFQPSERWRSRCRQGRVAVNPKHEVFPSMLAEALDVVWASGVDMAAAAAALGCSGTQLVRLIKQEPRAFVLLNGWRQDAGASPLR